MTRKSKIKMWGACYYCVCTACSALVCPFKHKLYRNCYRCHELGARSPRLDCDYFIHYLKHRRFKFRRQLCRTQHDGTYILIIKGIVFVGKYDELVSIANRLGGDLRPLEAVDFLTGDF